MRPSAPWPMRSISMPSKAYAELGTHAAAADLREAVQGAHRQGDRPARRTASDHAGTLCALADATAAEVTDVIDVFREPSRSFLMPPAGEALEPETVIDISHESLMRVWQRLIKWADEEAQSARIYRRLADTADLHAAGKANLWRDPELQLALDWRDKNQPNETWASRYHSGFAAAMRFLTESSEARDAERAERQSLRQREREAEQEKIEAQARNARRLFRAALVTGAVAVVALIFGVFAIYYFGEANKASVIAAANEAKAREYLARAQITESRSLVKTAEQNSGDQSMAILLALEALPDAKEGIERPFVFGAHKILAKGIDDLLELAVIGGHNDRVQAVAVMPDGRHIVTGSDDNMARMWDARSGAEVRQFKGHDGSVTGRGDDAGWKPHRHRLGGSTPHGCGTPAPEPNGSSSRWHPGRCAA